MARRFWASAHGSWIEVTSAFIDGGGNGVAGKPLPRRSRNETGSNKKIESRPPRNIQKIESQRFERW
ncbi:hypothetical protein, partial [Ralstonia pseudosolanacearum]|uniref:hypothetical protein n=1 Tax=Ralstonia pseudosolanacearum TaxID=1310165 RepID=UPI003CF39E6E